MKNFNLILSLFIIILISSKTSASETGYEVEIILFSYTNNQHLNSELWPENSTLVEVPQQINETSTLINTEVTSADFLEPIEATIESSIPETNKTILTDHTINTERDTHPNNSNLLASTETLDTLETIAPPPIDLTKEAEYQPAEEFRLQKQADTIDASSKYQLLVHTAWKQAGLDKKSAFSIYINSRKPENKDEIILEENSQNLITLKNNDQFNEDFIDGEIKFIMSRYLHINANFTLHHIMHIDDLESQKKLTKTDDYSITFDRRMRSREVHFIDHPLIGMLILATPFKILSAEEKVPASTSYKVLNEKKPVN